MTKDPQPKRKPDPCSFVIFGVTGDLDAPAGGPRHSITSRPNDLCCRTISALSASPARVQSDDEQLSDQPDEGSASSLLQAPGGR